MSKLGVLVVHGMGNQSADYAEPMIEELQAVYPFAIGAHRTKDAL